MTAVLPKVRAAVYAMPGGKGAHPSFIVPFLSTAMSIPLLPELPPPAIPQTEAVEVSRFRMLDLPDHDT